MASEMLQRVGALSQLHLLIRALNADYAAVLAEAGLGPDALDDPEAKIPFIAMGRLAVAAERATGNKSVGLMMGQRVGLDSLGVIGELMRHAPTLRHALADFTANQHRHANGGMMYLLEGQDHAVFGYAVYQPGMPGLAHVQDGMAAVTFRLVRELMRSDDAHGLEILLSRARPADTAPYTSWFGPKIHFDSDQTGVLLPLSWLSRPRPWADAAQRRIHQASVAAYWPVGGIDLATRVRRALRVGFVSGAASGEEIAAQLAIPYRTLRRRLEAEGLNFAMIAAEVRFDFAAQLLLCTSLTARDIGQILGYADPSAFSRAFLRWTGLTPDRWRVRHAVQVAASPASGSTKGGLDGDTGDCIRAEAMPA